MDSSWNAELQTQPLEDSDGNDLPDELVTVRAEPADASDPSDWTEAQDYPDVGDGVSDDNAQVDATVDLNSVLGNPEYNQDGVVTLDVYYSDPPPSLPTPSQCFRFCTDNWPSGWEPDWTYSYTVTVDTTERPESIMAQQTVTDDSGNPLPGVPTLARLEPVTDNDWASGEGPIVGAGMTLQDGSVDLAPALSQYEGDSDYETSNEVMIVDLYDQNADGDWDFVNRVPYYLGGSADPVLAQTPLQDANGNPLPNEPVVVEAVPTDPSSWDSSDPYPVVGTGASDSDSMIQVR